MLWVPIVLLLVSESLCQVPGSGSCPDFKAVSKFDLAKFMGKWYEEEKYFVYFEIGGTCATTNYTLTESGDIRVVGQRVSLNGNIVSIKGKTKSDEKSQSGELIVSHPTLSDDVKASFLVLDTNYDEWALLWRCQNVGPGHLRFAWIWTRKPNPGENVIKKAYAVVDKKGIDRKYFAKSKQQNCPANY